MLYEERNKFGNFKCACCGFYTIREIKETCPVCYWEEDTYQQEYIDDQAGPNLTSLRVSRENYKKLGAMNVEFKRYVRSPSPSELLDQSNLF